MEPVPLAVEAQSFNPWTTREVLGTYIFNKCPGDSNKAGLQDLILEKTGLMFVCPILLSAKLVQILLSTKCVQYYLVHSTQQQ